MRFKRNVGPYDRVFRILLGSGLVGTAVIGTLTGWVAWLVGTFGAALIVEGAIGY